MSQTTTTASSDNLQEMSFWDHLEELRHGLFRSVGVLLAVTVVLFFFKEFLFDDIILAPTRADFFLYRLIGVNVGLNLVNIDISAQFIIHLKVTFICAVVISCPYLIWEIWHFIKPALYPDEKRGVGGAFIFASGLFYLGVAVGYCVVLPLMVNFFQGYVVSDSVVNTISLTSYMSTVYSTVLLFGLVFEFPTLVAALSSLGVIRRKMLTKGWKIAVVAVVTIAALITPSGDPFSLCAVSVPLFFLYWLSILICKK